jgi:molybdenum cofactor cytidylyltransferase/nicotine blue oxidoreductase
MDYCFRFLFIITLMTSSPKQSDSSSMRLAVLLLAAGEGSRLGGLPKALIKKEGQTLLRRFSETIQGLSVHEFLVVTGFHANVIEDELAKLRTEINLNYTLVHNAQAHLGQTSSVRLGIESLTSDYDVLLIALCDQPEIDLEALLVLIHQFECREAGREILLPMVGEQRGNPVLFSKKVIEKILAIPAMACRPFMDRHPELVQAFITDHQAYILDVDTEDDIQKLGLERS